MGRIDLDRIARWIELGDVRRSEAKKLPEPAPAQKERAKRISSARRLSAGFWCGTAGGYQTPLEHVLQ